MILILSFLETETGLTFAAAVTTLDDEGVSHARV